MQPFKAQFILSRDYLAECFDESLPHGKNARPNFLFPTVMLAAGSGFVYFIDEPMGWFLVILGVLELIHIRYRRAWWLARQMWGASANSEVTLIIDDEGIRTESTAAHTSLLWADFERMIETDLGYILVDKGGAQQYLSKSLLPGGLIEDYVAQHKV